MENLRGIMNFIGLNTQSSLLFNQNSTKQSEMDQKLLLKQIINPTELQNNLFQIISLLINGCNHCQISTTTSTTTQESQETISQMEVETNVKSMLDYIKKPNKKSKKQKQQDLEKQKEKEKKCIFCQNPKQYFINSILNLLFESDSEKQAQERLIEIQKLGGSKGVCGKIMTKRDTGFKCLDCQLDNTCIICQECFEKGNHKGHRIYIQQGCAGCCDCGDEEAWKKEGNCSDHSGYVNQDKLSLDQIPKKINSNFFGIFTELFYQYFAMCENILFSNNSLQTNYINGHKKLSEYFSYIIELLTTIIGDNLLITYLAYNLLQQKIQFRQFKHCCIDLRTQNLSKQEHCECKCTIFENIFRFNSFLQPAYQKELTSYFISMNSLYSFKQYLILTYTKMYNFLIQDVDCKIFLSKIIDLSVQLFTSDELSIISIQSEYFYFILEKCQVYLALIVEGNISKLDMGNFLSMFYHIKYVCMKPLSLLKFVQKEGVFEKMMQIAKYVQFAVKLKMQKQKQQDDNFEQQGLIIDVEINILEIIYKMISCVQKQEIEQSEKQQIYIKWIQVVIIEILNTINIFQTKEQIFSSFHIPLHRILSLLVLALCDFNLENLIHQQQFHKIFETINININQIDNFDFSQFIVQQSLVPLQVFSFCKEIEKKIWINTSYDIQNYIGIYFKSKLLFFNTDTIFLQIAILINQNSQKKIDIFQLYKENFTRNLLWKFISGIKKIQNIKKIDTDEFQKIIPLASDFMNLISYLSVDQISIYNVCMKLFNDSPSHLNNFTSQCITPITVFMQLNKSIDLKSLKEKLCNNLLNNQTNFEEIMQIVCDFDKQKKQFKLKSNLEGQYVEPYIFYSDSLLFSDYNEKLSEKYKNKKEESYISVLGYISPDVKKSYLSQQIIAEIISDDTCSFFKFLLHFNNSPINKNIYLFNNFLTLQLKIISLYHESNFSQPNLISKFNNLLNEISKLDQIHEQTLSSIKFLSKKSIQLEITDENYTDRDTIILIEEESKQNKKEKALSKQQLILQQFQKKAKQFSDKNKQIIDTEENKNQNSNQELTCVICKDVILKDKENYAMAGYVTKSNILKFANFSMHKNQIQFEKNEIRLSQLELYSDIDHPIWELDNDVYLFSSCFHALHIQCTPNYQKRQVFKSEYEFSCPLCNRLSNIFINQLSGIQIFEKIDDEILQNFQQQKKSNKRQIKDLIDQSSIIQDKFEDLSISKKINIQKEQSQEIHDNLEKQVQQITLDNKIDIKEEEGIVQESIISENLYTKIDENNSKNVPNIIQKLKNCLYQFDQEKIVNSYRIDLLELDKNIIQSVTTFIDRFTIIKIHESDDLQNDSEILDLLENSIIESIKSIDLLGFSDFYNKEVPIQKQILLIYLIFFQKFQSSKKSGFLSKRKNFLESFVDLFSNTQDQQEQMSFAQIDIETYLVKINVYLGFYTQINNLDKIQNKILILLLISRVIQVSIKRNEQPQVMQRFSDSQYVKYLLPLLRKMLAFRIITKDFDEILIKKYIININQFNDDLQEFNHILYLLGIQLSQIQKIFTRNQQFFENQALQKFEFEFNIMKLQEDFTLSFIPLEDKFGDLYHKYMYMKCFKCNDFPKHHDMCICLLCGISLCSISCQQVYNYTVEGNLNKHCRQKHCGTSVFLSIMEASIYIIKSPLNACIGQLYFDQFGQSFDKKRKNWNDFYLDSEIFNKIRKMIINNIVAQEVIYTSLRDGQRYKEGIF